MTERTSYETDIRPLFTEHNILAMSDSRHCRRGGIVAWMLIPEEAAPQFRDDAAPRNGMMPPPDSEMIAPPITE